MDWSKLHNMSHTESMKAIWDELVCISNGLYEMNMEAPPWEALKHLSNVIDSLSKEIYESERQPDVQVQTREGQ